MHADMWATSLPCDLLLDIFRRLESTSLIRCAGVCRPWRRAITGNASCLRPRPDRFLPDLLLAFFDAAGHLRQHTTPGRIEDMPAAAARQSAENVVALESVVDVSLYHMPLTSRDGFFLLSARRNTVSNNLCLCNLQTRSCVFLPAAGFGEYAVPCAYVLATDYDDDDFHTQLHDGATDTSSSAVRILALAAEENRMTHRIFSSTSGAWGPVKLSAKLSLASVSVLSEPKHAVVCSGSVVYWLVILYTTDRTANKYSMFGMDMRTELTWETEAPKQGDFTYFHHAALVLATSEDGRRPSVIAWRRHALPHMIDVWVLNSDSWWTLQRTMHIQSWQLSNYRSLTSVWFCGFCPRSGYFVGIATGEQGPQEQFLVSVDGWSSRLMGSVASFNSCLMLPYEMDWSTYISKMKYL